MLAVPRWTPVQPTVRSGPVPCGDIFVRRREFMRPVPLRELRQRDRIADVHSVPPGVRVPVPVQLARAMRPGLLFHSVVDGLHGVPGGVDIGGRVAVLYNMSRRILLPGRWADGPLPGGEVFGAGV